MIADIFAKPCTIISGIFQVYVKVFTNDDENVVGTPGLTVGVAAAPVPLLTGVNINVGADV